MKNLLSIIFVLGTVTTATAQNIQASLNDAQTAYAANNSQEARQNLQQALIDLNELIGKKILLLMPPTLGGLEVNQAADEVIGGTGFAGLMVSRSWGNDNGKNIDVTLANDSPMLTMVNSFLSNEMLSGIMASQTGQKRVTVSGYKGMLEKSEAEDGKANYTINVPVDDTLFTFDANGFANESEVMALAQQINLNKIMNLLK